MIDLIGVHMRKALFWIGNLLCALGAALIVTSAVLSYMGFGTSYNLGDPAKFEFVLVPVWQIGVVIAVSRRSLPDRVALAKDECAVSRWTHRLSFT